MRQYEYRKDSRFVMATFLNKAYQTYKQINKSYREHIISDKELQNMENNIIKLRKDSLDDMIKIETESIDMTKTIEKTKEKISSLPFKDALKKFAFITGLADYAELLENAKEDRKQFLFQNMCPTIIYNKRGQQQCIVQYDDSKSDFDNYLHKMIRYNKFNIAWKVQADIYPALTVLLEEHREKLTKECIFEICSRVNVIPEDHIMFLVDGIHYGFNKEFIASTHLLIPQIENILRIFLNIEDVSTIHIDQVGIDKEKGLSTLLSEKYRDTLCRIISYDLYIDFKTILDGEQGGLNLRNDLLHGLACYDECSSVYIIYLWWVIFSWFYCIYMQQTNF